MSISEEVAPPLADRADELTATLAEALEAVDVPGAAFALARGDDIVTGAAGVLSRATGCPATADSYFQIGSITKVFTATMVMQLVDEGLIGLDEPVRSYLPTFDVGDADATASITVRHLLTHTSGIQGDYFAEFGRGSDAVARYVASLPGVGMLHAPGALFSYCNSGFVVLGLLLETLRGADYDTLLAERLLRPLSISGGTLPEQAILGRAAVGHVAGAEGAPAVPAPRWALPYSAGPAGSTPFMDPTGLVSFARLHLAGGLAPDGTRLLSQESVAAMQRLHLAIPTPGPARGIGANWIVDHWGDDVVIGHDGGTLGQYAFLRIHPATGAVIALLTNGPGGGELFDSFAKPLFARTAGIAAPPALGPAEHAPDLDLARLAGRYRHHGMTVQVAVTDGRATATATSDADPAVGETGDPEQFDVVAHSVSPEAVFLVTAKPLHGSYQAMMFPGGPQPPGYLRMGSRVFVRDSSNSSNGEPSA